MPDKMCRCGHEREAHTHYRRGTDCAICGVDVCQAFSAVRSKRHDTAGSDTARADAGQAVTAQSDTA